MTAPLNPVSARTEVKVPYSSPQILQPHVMGLFFDCSMVLGVDNIVTLDGVVNPATSVDWKLAEVVASIFGRASIEFDLGFAPVSVPFAIVNQNESDPLDETFIGFDLNPDYAAIQGFGDGNSVAAGLITYNLQSPSRQNGRIIITDQPIGAPRKTVPATPPDVDDTSLLWFLLKSNVPFCTQDGERFTRCVSISRNYNEKQLRDYGFAYNNTL